MQKPVNLDVQRGLTLFAGRLGAGPDRPGLPGGGPRLRNIIAVAVGTVVCRIAVVDESVGECRKHLVALLCTEDVLRPREVVCELLLDT